MAFWQLTEQNLLDDWWDTKYYVMSQGKSLVMYSWMEHGEHGRVGDKDRNSQAMQVAFSLDSGSSA